MRNNLFKIVMVGLLLGLSSCNLNDDNLNDNIEKEEIEEINFTGKTLGCGSFFVSKLIDDENFKTILTIKASGVKDINLTSEEKNFVLPNNEINLEISEWDADVNDYFCNDVPFEIPNKIKSWLPISGQIKVAITSTQEAGTETYYGLILKLENVVFENNSGEKRKISNLIIEEDVGFLPG